MTFNSTKCFQQAAVYAQLLVTIYIKQEYETDADGISSKKPLHFREGLNPQKPKKMVVYKGIIELIISIKQARNEGVGFL